MIRVAVQALFVGRIEQRGFVIVQVLGRENASWIIRDVPQVS